MSRLPVFIRGMKGLGDNLYQRPFVRQAAARWPSVFLETPWPELYEDLPNVRPVRSNTRLRTQAKNERASAAAWVTPPSLAKRAFFSYGSAELRRGNILEAMESTLRLEPLIDATLDLPATFTRPPPLGVLEGFPCVVLRPATVRREWSNPWRNPRPEYLIEAARTLRRAGYRVIVVADLEKGEEDLVGPLPPYDLALLGGDLSVRELFGLVERSAGIVGGVGWLVPAAIALRKPALVFLGGNGAHNAPHVITDPRLDTSRLVFARPDRLCMCEGKAERRRGHLCDKTISDRVTPTQAFMRMLPPMPLRSIESRSIPA